MSKNEGMQTLPRSGLVLLPVTRKIELCPRIEDFKLISLIEVMCTYWQDILRSVLDYSPSCDGFDSASQALCRAGTQTDEKDSTISCG